VRTARHLIKQHYDMDEKSPPDHYAIYVGVADLIGLWDETDHVPIWLSRVVKGIIHDMANCEETD
jgi:hypothetical protein